MKRCPECGREYDNSMMFCLDDGAELLYGPAAPLLPEEGWPKAGVEGVDEPATAILGSSAEIGEAATRAQFHTTEKTEAPSSGNDSFHKVGLSKKYLVALLLLAMIGAGAFVSYRYFTGVNNRIGSI